MVWKKCNYVFTWKYLRKYLKRDIINGNKNFEATVGMYYYIYFIFFFERFGFLYTYPNVMNDCAT